ncbi:hypothetical protein DJ031_04640 [bacterium endosymbiont of Escarpia laminata]|nr:MAG: hypothetical protein DJ031_04640 [bacterium endosymbiont of Escarpia laminata]
MSTPQTKAANIVLGAGYLYFDEEDASGNLTGERYIGDTPGFSLSIATEKVDIDSSDGPVAEELVSITKKVKRGGSVGVRDVEGDNLAAFVLGDKSTKTQTSTPVVDEAHTVDTDRYYQLGASVSNPTGVRNVSSVVVTGTGGTPTYTVTSDYVVNAVEGRIYIVPGGAITDGTGILVDYTPAANTREQVVSNTSGAKTGALRFVADNTAGANRDLYIPRCEMAPSGDLSFKSRDNAQEMTFDINVQTKTGYAQVYIEGQAA